MKFPKGYLKLIAERAGINHKNVRRDLLRRRPSVIEAAKSVLTEAKEDMDTISSLLSQIKSSNPSVSNPKRKKPSSVPEWFTVDQAASALGLSRDTIIRYCKGTGSIKWEHVQKVGRQWRIHQSHITK